MAQRLDSAFVKAAFELAGYTMLESYINSKIPVKVRCSNGHDRKISYGAIKLNAKCLHCSKNYIDPKTVKAAFELAGYTMLESYINSKIPVKVRCSNGHDRKVSYGSIRLNAKCLHCSKIYIAPETVKKAFEAEGYQLLVEYKKSDEKLLFICPQKHRHSISWDHFKQGARCAYCAGSIVTHDQVKAAFEAEGYQLLSEYKKSDEKLSFICPQKHQHSISWESYKNGNRCAYCAGSIVTHDQVKKAFEAEGYQLLVEYKKSDEKLLFICPRNHQHSISWGNFNYGIRCGVCFIESQFGKYSKLPVFSRIVGSIKREILRQGLDVDWTSLYEKDLVLAISEPLKPFYRKRPKGHHVDHIIPITWFNLLKEDELTACWSINNLRYLPALENMARCNRASPSDIEYMRLAYPEVLKKASKNPNKGKISHGANVTHSSRSL